MKTKLTKISMLLMAFAISIQLQAITQSPQKALNFNGSTQYVSGTTGISTSLTAITIEAWVNHNTLPAGAIQRYVTIQPEVACLRYDGSGLGGTNQLHFYIKNSAGSIVSLRVDNVLSTGTWMHVAGTYEGTTMKLYLNGKLLKSGAAVGLTAPSGAFLFGANGAEAFNGKMDEVSVWNYARSMADIREDMYRNAPTANANLKNYWQFNNGSGTTLTDLKGTATGTLNNMTNTNWIASTIPFAAGAVNTQRVTTTGTTTFTGTGLVANFTAKSGTDTIVASRIDTLPNVSPAGVPTVFNSQYWVVKRFGTGTFTSNLTFTISEDLTATDESLPANISLYARADNSDAGWTSLATATSVNAANNTATFNGISGFSQFIVVRNCIPPAISSQSTASQTQPENCSFYPITVTATGTNITYQWFSNASASNSGGTSLGSGNGAQTYSYTPPGKAAGTLYFYCVVSGCGPSQTSAVSGAFISTPVAAPAGSGTLADPYRIASLDNLCWLQSPTNSSYWTSNFIQTADINAAPCKNWNGGTGFSPIGYLDVLNSIYYKFTGTYNGKGHAVDSIYINRLNSNMGFFGYLKNATIDSLSVTNVSIRGTGTCGGLAGYVVGNTTISYCSSSGSITGNNSYGLNFGGLVGDVNGEGGPLVLLKYCYSSAKVSHEGSNYENLGGLVGINSGRILQCYSTGLVITDPVKLIHLRGGGFLGYQSNGFSDSSYWDIETSGQATGGKDTDTTQVHGRSTTQMKTQSTYAGWDFTNRWYISANANNGYPCFYYRLSKVSTQAVTNIANYSAIAHGKIERKGTLNITSYGVCYNTTGTPTVADSKVNLGTTNINCAFSANMTGLHHGTTYYVRAYAINERDTVYGEQQSFTTTNVTQAATCLFNGDQYNYISIPNNSSLQLTNNYSIEVWLKPGVAVSTNRIIVSKGYNAGGYTLLSSGSGNQRGLIFDGMATADNILTQNQWCHVAAVNNNGTRHLYLNGVEMPLTGTPASVTANTQPLYLSNYDNGGPSNVFRGYIEEVRLWNTAMPYSQIRENMHLPLTGSETGLVSYWQFDEGQPPTVYDKKGVNNGTWYASVINQYKTSTIPFGSGYCNTQVVSTTGTTTFTNTGLAINFTTKTGLDSIVVAKIDTFPNLNPTGLNAVFDRQYWAVHKYGTGTFTANLTFTISEDLMALDQGNPSNIKLYTRSSTADDTSWVELASATSVNAAAKTATFNGISGFSQFIVVRASNYPPTAINSQSTAGQTQTLNGTFTPITVTATGTNVTYQWYKNATASNSGGTSLGTNNGAQTNSYTPQASKVGTLYYYCVVNGDCGTPQTTAVSGAFHVNPIAIAPAGSGTAGDPYRIANLNNLYYLSITTSLWDKGYTFIQTANINAAETRNWDGGQGFIPIGNQSVQFKGNYHGKGNSIDSLYINRPGSNDVAFFGEISQTPSSGNSRIDSLGLTNVNITGSHNVGGLGGYAVGFNISHCSVIGGSVIATNSQYSAGVGGMFGCTSGAAANNNSTSHCFAAVAVSGQGEVGGFVGQTYGGYINQCYSAGSVSGTGEYVGGFVGYRMSLGVPYSLDSSYYDIQASGQATGAGRNDQPAYNHLQGKTTAEMKTQATYDGWNFSTVWKISGSVNNGYPYFDYPTQISTATVSNIANNTATATGTISHIGALAITAHGFCWNTTGTPTLADSKINLGATTTSADYSASINSFNHNTTYYLRAYLIDAQDTIYGNVVNFTTTNVLMGVTCVGLATSSVSTRIRVPDNNTLDLTNNYSIEVWINPSNQYVVTGDLCLIWKGESSLNNPTYSSYSLGRLPTGNSLGLTFDGMSTADNILVPNTWNHIAAVNDNGTRHIYVNGVEYPLTGTPRTITANTLPLIIGCGVKAASWKTYYGKYDEMSLWNTVLSQSQIREHMHFPLSGSETGLVSYWQFNEGSGTSINDKMGINNGTLVRNGYGDDGYTIEPDSVPFWHGSTIPFGLGYSNTQVVTATGTNTFTNAGLAMNFTAKTGMDSIVVARIDTFPNINPTGLNAVFDRQYWAVHKYGTGTLTANLTFTISEGFTADDQSVPSKIKLYKRGSMADDSTWVYVASASTVNATTKQATFNGISDFSQFIIARGACVVYIPDANFKAALLANASINTNGDNEIQCTEATAFTGTIDVTSANIADMTGIEAFTNITELNCGNNLLTTLNVSNNTALTYLYCNGNQLTSLDVSTNTALLYLLCDHNQLTSLNVSTIAPLKQLHCNNNALSNLDVSLNTALLALNCQYNSLTSLNVKNGHNTSLQTFVASNNSGLSCIQVDDAIYSATHWMSKDATASYSTSCGMVTETMGIAKTTWSVYPNPVSDELIIEAENMNENSRYEFINSVGQVISAGTLMTKTSIKTSSFPMGIYLLKVGNGQTFEIRKIVKK